MSPDPNPKQAQRLWPRWFVAGTKPVKVDLGPAGAGPLVDISGGGFRIQSLAPLRRGAEVPVRIEIPNRLEPLQASGIVVWSKPNGAAGVRFTSLADSQKAILHAWLAELEQLATAPAQGQVQDEFTTIVSQIRGAQLNNADALNTIVRRAKELNSVSGVAIALGTPESMICMAAAGEAPKVGSAVPAVIGITGECVFKRKLVHCEDSKNDPRVGRDCSFGSAVILPLIVNNEVRGVLQAFSKRSYAFTATAIDSLEKLADAVIFVTHGIVTQRRLATAKASLSATHTSLGPKPAPASSSLTASWTAPEATPAASHDTHAGRTNPGFDARPVTASNAIAASTASMPAVRFEPVAIATSIAEPIAAPVPRPRVEPRVRTRPSPRPQAYRQEEYGPQRSGMGKWIAAVAVVVVGASGWYYMSHYRHAAAVEITAPVASAASNEPLEASLSHSTHPAKAEVGSARPSNALAAVPAVTVAEHVSPAAPKHEEKHEAQTAPPPEPEPIVLSANTPKAPQPMDLDAVVPVKLPNPLHGPESAAIALPTMAKPVPKLAATLNIIRTDVVLVKRVNPIYPPVAKSARIQGTVELRLTIGKDGSVTKVSRLSGQPLLAGAAVNAVKQWVYQPAKVNGEPIEAETTVKLSFELYQ